MDTTEDTRARAWAQLDKEEDLRASPPPHDDGGRAAELERQLRSKLMELDRKLGRSWTAFSDAMPAPHRKLLVTNCADCKNASGFASHVWIVDMVHHHDAGEVTAFAHPSDMPLRFLTHWRYALPEEV